MNRPVVKYEFKLTDEFGNKYQPQLKRDHPFLTRGMMGMTPKSFAVFRLPIAKPVEPATRLSLELPSLVVESDEKYRFSIPIKRETITYKPLADELFGMVGEKEAREVLFKRDDFQEWFSRWNSLKTKGTLTGS
jgi:hypothetical protein